MVPLSTFKKIVLDTFIGFQMQLNSSDYGHAFMSTPRPSP